ncbi:MAG: D-2-hydroxyacid dehydrogenase [Caldilineaceae bacterium]
MPKLVMMPPQSEKTLRWANQLLQALPDYQVSLPETDEEAISAIAEADAAFGEVPPAALAAAKHLRWIQSPAAGPPAGFYYQELIEHPVQVCNPRGIYNDHIAQHILMVTLALARGLPWYLDAQRERRWDVDARKSRYVDLIGSTALIVGLGGIGHETARLCNAFGMKVIGTDARWEYAVPNTETYPPEALDGLLPQADFVIITVPHTPQTAGMWHRQRFQLMKPSAYFINIGRGATTKLADLTAALQAGEIAGCALDVFESEPLPADHPLWAIPNVILTPHIAVHEAPNIDERQFGVFLENARRLAADEPLINVVDKANWF